MKIKIVKIIFIHIVIFNKGFKNEVNPQYSRG